MTKIMKLFDFLERCSPSPSPSSSQKSITFLQPSASPSPRSKKSNTNDSKKFIRLPFFKSCKNVKVSSCKSEKHALSFESSKELEQTFMVFDKNGDGHISVGELKAWMHSFLTILGKATKPSEKELAFMLAQADKDGDGFLTLADFREFLFSSSSSSRLDEEEAAWFNAVDLNNDGVISCQELHKLMVQNLGMKSCTLQECRLIIEAHDSDGDGLLNAQDFRKLFVG